jgi:hypothetical protein
MGFPQNGVISYNTHPTFAVLKKLETFAPQGGAAGKNHLEVGSK